MLVSDRFLWEVFLVDCEIFLLMILLFLLMILPSYFFSLENLFSGWEWGEKFLYQLSDSDLSAIRINLHKNPAIATVRSPMSISVSQSQSYHEFALQGVSKEGCATVQISNEQRRGADNSSNLNLWEKKEAHVCENLIWAKEEQRAVQISRCEQGKELVSANSPMMNSMSIEGSSCLRISNEHQKWFFQRKIYQYQRKSIPCETCITSTRGGTHTHTYLTHTHIHRDRDTYIHWKFFHTYPDAQLFSIELVNLTILPSAVEECSVSRDYTLKKRIERNRSSFNLISAQFCFPQ